MKEFSEVWNNEVRALAKACVTEPKLIRLMLKDYKYKPTCSEKAYIKDIKGKYKDIPGMYNISDMIRRVDRALADGKIATARLAILQVYEVLNSPSYFKKVFHEDPFDEEWITRKELRDGLEKLIYL